jgi:hypothetical protein
MNTYITSIVLVTTADSHYRQGPSVAPWPSRSGMASIRYHAPPHGTSWHVSWHDPPPPPPHTCPGTYHSMQHLTYLCVPHCVFLCLCVLANPQFHIASRTPPKQPGTSPLGPRHHSLRSHSRATELRPQRRIPPATQYISQKLLSPAVKVQPVSKPSQAVPFVRV